MNKTKLNSKVFDEITDSLDKEYEEYIYFIANELYITEMDHEDSVEILRKINKKMDFIDKITTTTTSCVTFDDECNTYDCPMLIVKDLDTLSIEELKLFIKYFNEEINS